VTASAATWWQVPWNVARQAETLLGNFWGKRLLWGATTGERLVSDKVYAVTTNDGKTANCV